MRSTALLLSALLATSAVAQDAPADVHLLEALAKQEASGFLPQLRSGGDPGRGFDLHHHRFHWTIDPAVNAIHGSVSAHFTATETLPALVLDLSDSLQVDSVLHQGQPLAFQHAGDSLWIPFPAPLATGTVDSVTVHYGATPSSSGLGSWGFDTHDGIPIIWTLSQPYGAMDWWPAKQDLNDKIDSIDTYVTIPVGNRAAGNGVLVATDTLPGDQQVRFHWRHRHPIAYYLIATAVTNYVELVHTVELPADTFPMLTYAYPEDAFLAGLNAGDVLQQMPFFSQLFGTYPFADEKYGHAQMERGGGMEHQTMTFMGAYFYELAAHELAHQWFGNKVTCGSWQDLWLNEGFATYLSGLCYQYLAPQYWPGWPPAKIAVVTSEPGGSVWVPDTLDVQRLFNSRLTYTKGAMVLHTLRWVCGDSAFFNGVYNYLHDPALAFGTARTSDLQAHLEATSGLDLTEFLNDWFYGEGYPSYTLTWSQDGGGTVNVQLDQSTSHPSVDFFALPVPVLFKNGQQDSLVVLDHTFSGQTFSFTLPFQADSALLDPDWWIIRANDLVLRVPDAAFGSGQALLVPNPVRDQAELFTGTRLQGPATLRLLDASGRLVRQQQVVITGRRTTFSTADLAPGSYLVELAAGTEQVRLWMVKD